MDISTYQHMHIRMSTRGKRPLRNLTPTDKVRAIQRIHNGETKASVSRDIGVPESTLRGWCKNEQKLRFMCRQVGTSDQLVINIPCMENPPEKRVRFDNGIPPKSSHINPFNEILFNHSPFSTIVFPPSNNLTLFSSNNVKDRVYFDGHTEGALKTQASAMSTPNTNLLTDDYSQHPVRNNINLLSLLYPVANIATICDLSNKTYQKSANRSNKTSNTVTRSVDSGICSRNNSNSDGIPASLTVKNWAKDPAKSSSTSTDFKFNSKYISDWNNNPLNERQSSVDNDILSCLPPLPTQILQIPIVANKLNSDVDKSALLDWCKVFNASLSFLALTTAAAALQPGIPLKIFPSRRPGNELACIATRSHYSSNVVNLASTDVSNDSICETEPEDLSLHSSTTTNDYKTLQNNFKNFPAPNYDIEN